ncbi:hypothetical protein MMC13_002039 [Lambiella insularis]|nr:hypothetical protein [Lambiella insularis]
MEDCPYTDHWNSSIDWRAGPSDEHHGYSRLPRFNSNLEFVFDYETDEDHFNRVPSNRYYEWLKSSGLPSVHSRYSRTGRIDRAQRSANLEPRSQWLHNVTNGTRTFGLPLRGVSHYSRHPHEKDPSKCLSEAFHTADRDSLAERWSSIFSGRNLDQKDENATHMEASHTPLVVNPLAYLYASSYKERSPDTSINRPGFQPAYRDNYSWEALPFPISSNSAFSNHGSPSLEQPGNLPNHDLLTSNLYCSRRPNLSHQTLRGRVQHNWRLLQRMMGSMRRQRQQLSHDEMLLQRSKQILESEWHSFRLFQESDLRRREPQRVWSHDRYYFDDADIGHSWNEDPPGQCGRGNRTRQQRATMRYANAETNETRFEEDSRSHHSEERFGYNGGGQDKATASLPAEAIAKAKMHLENYKSSWSLLLSSAAPPVPTVPYPTPNLQPASLLGEMSHNHRHFSDTRIQFHTLEFFLHPFGLRPSLTRTPPVGRREELPQEPSYQLDVTGLTGAHVEIVEELSTMMGREVKNWHADKLECRGLSAALNKEHTVMEQADTIFMEVGDHRLRVTQWDLYQGIWAAIRRLRELVKGELERRRTTI